MTNSAYGVALKKMVCLGFVQHPSTIKGEKPEYVTDDWLLEKSAEYAINIAGIMVGISNV